MLKETKENFLNTRLMLRKTLAIGRWYWIYKWWWFSWTELWVSSDIPAIFVCLRGRVIKSPDSYSCDYIVSSWPRASLRILCFSIHSCARLWTLYIPENFHTSSKLGFLTFHDVYTVQLGNLYVNWRAMEHTAHPSIYSTGPTVSNNFWFRRFSN
jgi:hypothetical protein